jgi:hypothetical protein
MCIILDYLAGWQIHGYHDTYLMQEEIGSHAVHIRIYGDPKDMVHGVGRGDFISKDFKQGNWSPCILDISLLDKVVKL